MKLIWCCTKDIISLLQTVTVTVEDPNTPLNIPVPVDIGPVTQVEVEVTTTRDDVEQPTPENVEILVKGCLEGKCSIKSY